MVGMRIVAIRAKDIKENDLVFYKMRFWPVTFFISMLNNIKITLQWNKYLTIDKNSYILILEAESEDSSRIRGMPFTESFTDEDWVSIEEL